MASKSLSSINFKLRADIKHFSTGLQNAQRKMKKFAKKMDRMGQNMTRNFTAPLAGMATLSVMAWDKQAQAIAQVETGLKSTGNQVGKTSKQLQKMASDLQKKTIFGDEEILKNATAQLLTFTNITGDQFERTQQAALDLATRLDGDLKSASIQLGKALNDPVANLSALSRSGIQFSKDQKELINSLWKTGRTAEAQNIILQELEKQYGGSAEAAAKAGAGGIKQLKNSIGDLAEEFGKIIHEYITPFIEKLKGMIQRFSNLSEATKKNIIKVAALTATIGPILIVFGKLILAFSTLRLWLFNTIAPMVMVGKKLAAITRLGYANGRMLGAVTALFKGLRVVIMANPWGALFTALATGVGLWMAFRDKNKAANDELDNTAIAAKSAAERLAEINDELEASGKNKFELLREEIGKTLDPLTEKSQKLQKRIAELNEVLFPASGMQVWNPELQQELATLTEQYRAIGATVTGYNAAVIKLDKKEKEYNDSLNGTGKALNTLSNNFKKAKTAAQQYMDIVEDSTLNDPKPLELKGGRMDVNFQTADPFEGIQMKLNNLSGGILAFAEKWGDAFGAAFSVIGQSLENQGMALDNFYEKESQAIEKSTMTAKQKADAQEALDEDVAEKRLNIMRKQAIADKAAAIFSAIIGTAEGVARNLKVLPVAIAVGVLGAAQIALIASQPLPEFAAGGIVSGPTIGMMGEYPGARTNPEVIAPLDKLRSMLGDSGGTQTLIPDVTIKGEDLVISFERTQRRKDRR